MRISNNASLSNSTSDNSDKNVDDSADTVVSGDNADAKLLKSMQNNPDFYLEGGSGQLSERGFQNALGQGSFESGSNDSPIPISFRGDNIGYWGTDRSEQGRLWGNNSFFTLRGGDDRLWTIGDNAKHFGGDGNDDLRAVGNDHDLNGGNGNDVLLTQGENNMIHGDAGNDQITQRGGFGNVAYGGDGDDKMTGAGLYLPSESDSLPLPDPALANKMYGEGGDDEMLILSRAREGSEAYGGIGNDKMIAIGGNMHKLYGGEGTDKLEGLSGTRNAILDGGAGSDSVLIRSTDSEAYGGDGNDIINNEGIGNTLYGGAGDDFLVVQANAVDSRSFGGEGGDSIIQRGAHYASGGEGNDSFTSLTGSGSTFSGGEGVDSLTLDIPYTSSISIEPALGLDNTYFTIRDGNSANANVYQINSMERIEFANGFAAEQNEQGDWMFFEV